jgi:hypothetical protein
MEEEARCRTCGSGDISEALRSKRDRLCRACHGARSARWRKTSAGVASKLRDAHGLGQDESERWAVTLTDEKSRCGICGVMLWWLRKQGTWLHGGKRCNQRLTLDHVTPGVADGNYRALCFSCNRLRGAAVLTDENVLNEVRSWYRALWPLRFLFWLNTSPGIGGRANRSERCQKRDAEFASGHTEKPPDQ